ncbi:MAG: hypothetical protein ACYS47_11440 [Planctomycetota bacterium]|jgi:hypothetical protein
MEAFYTFANFAWGVFFFVLGIAGGILAAVKLQGWWRALPLGMAVMWGVGTGLFMWGQFWVDQYMGRETPSTVPVMGGQLTNDLDLLARSTVKSMPEFDTGSGETGLVLDGAYLSFARTRRPARWGSRIRHDVTLSYLCPSLPELDRLYVECKELQSGQWVIVRVFSKQSAKGKIVEVDLWRA